MTKSVGSRKAGPSTDNQGSRPAISASCGKRVFDSRDRAKKWAKARKQLNLRPYECRTCGLWHLTSWSAAEFAGFREREAARRNPL